MADSTLSPDVELPMVGWECDKCGEPYNSRTEPDLRFCGACGDEVIWQLPEMRTDMYQQRLRATSVSDVITVVPHHGVSFRAPVVESEEGARIVEGEQLTVARDTETVVEDDIYYVTIEETT